MMPGPSPSLQEMRHEELLRVKENDIKDHLTQKEKELNSMKKRKKTLTNKQKNVSFKLAVNVSSYLCMDS